MEGLNHLSHELVRSGLEGSYVNHNKSPIYSKTAGKYLRYATHAIPLLGALVPKVGLPWRFITDISESLALKKMDKGQFCESLFRSVCSGVSAYYIFFNPKYSNKVEALRSLVMHAKDLYQQEGKIQPAFHVAIDIIQLIGSQRLEVQCISYFAQCIVGVLDAKGEYAKGSYLGTAVYAARSALCLFSLGATVSAFQAARLSQVSLGATVSALQAARLSQVPASSPSIPEAAILYHPGTGAPELEKLQVLQYLGRDGLTSDCFLVQDEDGTIKVLKRFLTEAEKIEKSGVYAFMYIILFPFSLFWDCVNQVAAEVKKSFRLSALNDPSLLHVFKKIENTYPKKSIEKGQPVTQPFTDTYLLMECFQGSSLAEWKGSLPIEMVQKIATTLSNVAINTKYVYKGNNLGDIAIAGDALKFTSFNNFGYSRSWQSALDSYNDLYNFFMKLASLMPKKEKWIEKLNLIFSFRDLTTTYWEADSDTRKALEESHKDVFNIELLQRTLAQVQALFSSAKGG